MFRENCFENVVSDLKNNNLCVHNTTFKKKWEIKKKKKNKKKRKEEKKMRTFKIFGGFWGQN